MKYSISVSMFKFVWMYCLFVACQTEDFQRWSIQTKKDVPLTLECVDDFNNTMVSLTDKLVWRRKDHEGAIENSNSYTLSSDGGVNNKKLNFTVTDETNGIYFCEVTATMGTSDPSDDQLKGVIIKGVNLGVYDYDDFLDKYERDLVVGAIAAGSVFLLVVSVGLLNAFQYRSEEQLAKERARKAERVRRLQQPLGQNGYDNKGMTLSDMPKENDNVISYSYGDQDDQMKTSF